MELVICRFDQHYQNMCGFDSLETARTYLNLCELVNRLTPFVEELLLRQCHIAHPFYEFAHFQATLSPIPEAECLEMSREHHDFVEHLSNVTLSSYSAFLMPAVETAPTIAKSPFGD